MKKRNLWVGFSLLLLAVVAIGVLFSIRPPHTPQEVSTESNEIDAIIALYPLEEQDETRAYYEAEMQKAKATGNAGFVARFREMLQTSLQEDIDDPIPDDHREAAQYYEAEIQKEKAAGASEYYIGVLEYLRDGRLRLAESEEENERESREELARYYALRTPEEKLAYYEEKRQKNEAWLRQAIAAGDAGWIKFAQMAKESDERSIEYYKRRIAWNLKKPELDAQLERADAARSQLIDRYRHLLHIEVVDGVEEVVGVRTPDEITSSPSEKAERNSFPAEAPSPLPVMPDDVSASPPVVENTPIPSLEGSLESVIKAETQFKSWRKTIDTDYVDVLVSQYMTPQEINQHFPTQAERDQLKSRTTEMRKAVVSKIRNVVNGIQGATVAQKRALARKLATSNFDSEFAESVLKQLDFDDK